MNERQYKKYRQTHFPFCGKEIYVPLSKRKKASRKGRGCVMRLIYLIRFGKEQEKKWK